MKAFARCHGTPFSTPHAYDLPNASLKWDLDERFGTVFKFFVGMENGCDDRSVMRSQLLITHALQPFIATKISSYYCIENKRVETNLKSLSAHDIVVLIDIYCTVPGTFACQVITFV